MMEQVKKFKGTVKAYRKKQSYSMVEYVVILYRGEEEDLIKRLDGDLKNLITFCDNNFKFDNITVRHYGGKVRKMWIKEYGDKDIKGYIHKIYSYSEKKPEDKYIRAYEVTVYID